MKDEDLHWLYIFHYWLDITKPKFKTKEDENIFILMNMFLKTNYYFQ